MAKDRDPHLSDREKKALALENTKNKNFNKAAIKGRNIKADYLRAKSNNVWKGK